jgi:hypothetical protein
MVVGLIFCIILVGALLALVVDLENLVTVIFSMFALAYLGFLALIIFVAYHFIVKYW